ncbi:MAG: hypothetical protein ACRERU_17215, partial [Methylococcales bacterium]
VQYVANFEEIIRLAIECEASLDLSDPDRRYFNLISATDIKFNESLFRSPSDIYSLGPSYVLDHHLGLLRLLAAAYNRGIGFKREPPRGFLGKIAAAFADHTEVLIPDINPSHPKIRDIFPRLLEAMRTQVNYANNLSWRFG